jgi:uncharacterized protein YkwD
MLSETSHLLVLLLAFFHLAQAAPIVTVYQTEVVDATAVAGSIPVASSPVQPVASAAPVAAASTTTNSLESIFDKILGFFNSGSNSATSSTPSTATTSSSGEGFFAKLLSFFDLDSTSSAATPVAAAASTPGAAVAALAAAPANKPISTSVAFALPATSSPSTNTYVPTTVSTSTKSSSTSTGGNSGLYSEMSLDSRVDVPWAKKMVDGHNVDRAKHQAGPLSWSNAAYQYAQKVADAYDCSGVLTHTGGPFGENLAAGYQGLDALNAWYIEGDNFPYGTESEYNHFTQVVWKSSTTVGCAWKDCSAENWGRYIVCEYDPPGNVIGFESKNVLPPTGN